jgi:peroxiredoxin Q/BCP
MRLLLNSFYRYFSEETDMARFMVLLALFCTPAIAADLEVGDQAPSFVLTGSDGEEYSLEQFRGKKAVVIAWYPKAFTGG